MESHNFFVITTISAFCALFATIFQGYFSSNQLRHLTVILSSLVELEYVNQTADVRKIAVGFGAWEEIYTDPSSILNLPIGQTPGKFDHIETESELTRTFGYYFSKGNSSEVIISNKSLFDDLVQKTDLNDSFSIGAPVVAQKFAKGGAKVLLLTDISEKQRSILSPEISYLNHSIHDPNRKIVVKYKTGDTWGQLKAPSSGQITLQNSKEDFPESHIINAEKYILSFQPKLLIITGLKTIPIYDQNLNTKFKLINNLIKKTNPLVHLEIPERSDYLSILNETVLHHLNSMGLTTKELDFLDRFLIPQKEEHVSNQNPEIDWTVSLIKRVFLKLKSKSLSRIHVQAEGYQVIMTVVNSPWKKTKRGTAAASMAAHRRFCKTEFVNPEAAQILIGSSYKITIENKLETINLIPTDPVHCWKEEVNDPKASFSSNVEFCVAPVLMCRFQIMPGTRDAISAAALNIQI